jgi:hypothetical protein
MKMTTADSFVLFMQNYGGCQKVLGIYLLYNIYCHAYNLI